MSEADKKNNALFYSFVGFVVIIDTEDERTKIQCFETYFKINQCSAITKPLWEMESRFAKGWGCFFKQFSVCFSRTNI